MFSNTHILQNKEEISIVIIQSLINIRSPSQEECSVLVLPFLLVVVPLVS